MDIEIEVIGKGKTKAILDERNPKTAQIIYENLPLEGEANIWLEEIYFDVPLKLDYENPSSTTKKGDISYWPPDQLSVYSMDIHNQLQMLTISEKLLKTLNYFSKVKNDDKIIIRKFNEI